MISLLIFEGEYDLSLRKRIRQDLDVVRYDECLIIDLSTVSYCEASCLAEFVLLARDRHERRALPAMIVPSPVMKRLFEITHVDSHFTILEAVEDGVRDDNAAVSVHGATRGYESLFFHKPPHPGDPPSLRNRQLGFTAG
jgi:anti-anti-sigma regulatory factor